MSIDRSFGWLGRFPLAVDLADTVRLVQGEAVELLVDDEALAKWVATQLPRFPAAESATGQLADVRGLRDAVRDVLLAHVSGGRPPGDALEVLNGASARCPSYPVMSEDGTVEVEETGEDQFDVFAAQVARSAFEVLGGEPEVLAVCKAPSCGMLFVPQSRRQRWCSDLCGNRARVARHAARTRQRQRSH